MPASRKRRSTGRRPSARKRRKPATHLVLRLVEERLPKDPYLRTDFRVDGQGRVRHGWHAAHTMYARIASAWVRTFFWCPACKVGEFIPPARGEGAT